MALPETTGGILLIDSSKNNIIVSRVDRRRRINVSRMFFGVPDELLLARDRRTEQSLAVVCLFVFINLSSLKIERRRTETIESTRSHVERE